MGSRDQFTELIAAKGVEVKTILGGKIRRYFSFMNFLDAPKIVLGIFQAIWKMFWSMPDVVFSKGGTGSLPVVLVAAFYRIPIVIHDSDAKFGLNNSFAAGFAKRIGVSFKEALALVPERKAFLAGNPVRQELTQKRMPQDAAKKELGFDPAKPLLFVVCGSRGATRINEFILSCLKEFLGVVQILHQTGMENYDETVNIASTILKGASPAYRATAFLTEHMASALSAADVVMGRAGSGMIFEVAAFGKPAMLIPLPESARDHQRENAYAFERAGGGVVIEEKNLLPHIVLAKLHKLLENRSEYETMSKAASSFFIPDAAERIAEEIVNAAKGEKMQVSPDRDKMAL